jgi:hypothetical protein
MTHLILKTRQLLVSAAAAASMVVCGVGGAIAAKPASVTFALHVNPPFLACVGRAAKATAKVTRGPLADFLELTLTGFKPGLAFDLFTVQRSNLRFDGSVDPNFKNFGLAWYQSDVHTDAEGNGKAFLRTILLDQIFGFDPDAALPPTNTFHLGFWFNNPNAAKPCGFDVTKPTPFNGEHKAGPLAFISTPKRGTGLGPLCSDPNTSTVPATCNP